MLTIATPAAPQSENLPRLIEQAAAALAKATTAGEVLEARDAATLAYDIAKRAARFHKAKQAHDTIIAACKRAMADALQIEASAQCRLADEYDAAQDRGEIAKHSSGNPQIVPNKNDLPKTAADLDISRKEIHAARRVRDAEKAKPGIVRETLATAGAEPTRARLKRAVDLVLEPPKPPSAKAQPTAPQAVSREEDHEQERDDIDDAIDLIIEHLETLEPDEQRGFIDQYILLPVGLTGRRITRTKKLIWEHGRSDGCYRAAIMNETHVPFYFLNTSDTDEKLYGVEIFFPMDYEILIDSEKEPLSLDEAKKFAETHHAKGK